MLRIVLLAASIAMLSGGALAARSAIGITQSVYVEPLHDGPPLKTGKAVLVMKSTGVDASRPLLLAAKH